METIEAKIYLLQSPGVNKVKDKHNEPWWCDDKGLFHTKVVGGAVFEESSLHDSMHAFAPFTKVEPERSNADIAEDVMFQYRHTDTASQAILENLLNIVDEKIRKAK